MSRPEEDEVLAVADPSLQTVAQGVSWRAASKIVGQGTWYASLLVLAILLPPGAFGAIAVGSVIVSATTLLVESGTGGAIVVSDDVSRAYLRRSALRTAGVGIALAGLTAALAGPITDTFADGTDPNVLRVMVISVAMAALAIVPIAVLEKTMSFRRIALLTIAAAVLASIAAVIAGALDAGVWALVVRLVVYQVLMTGFAWWSVRDLLPRGDDRPAPRRTGASWFLGVAAAGFLAQTLDNLVVGYFTDVRQLGQYALAFSLAFAPLSQVSYEIGGVLFPAIAATRDRVLVAERTLKALRMMGLLLLPLAPVGIVLAPGVIPELLGDRWEGMVTPFQLLLVVGVGQGVLNVLAEVMSASGGVETRARIDLAWAAITMVCVGVGASVHDIEGAAIAHVGCFVLLAGAYVVRGARVVGLEPWRLLGTLRGVGLAVAAQAAVTAAVAYELAALDASAAVCAVAGAVAGVAALLVALPVVARSELAELLAAVGAVRRRRGGGVAEAVGA